MSVDDVIVIVPALDEAAAIGTVVVELRRFGYEVVVVDDGSTDATATRAREAGAAVLRHAVNLGQGAALQTGFEHARRRGAGIVVTFDADGQHRVEDVVGLVDAVRAGAEVALGSRGLGGTIGASRGRRTLLWCATRLSNALARQRLTDSHCGLRAIRVAALAHVRLRCDGMAHASELLARAGRAGLRIVEVPVVVRYTAYSRQKGQRLWAAVRILWDVLVRAPILAARRGTA